MKKVSELKLSDDAPLPVLLGTATLVLGVKSVAYAALTNASIIMLAPQGLGTLAGTILPPVRTNGTGFQIVSTNLVDTGVVGYAVFEP